MKRWQWITLAALAALAAAVALGWATRQPLGRPGIYVNLDVPVWLAAALVAAVTIRLGWELYRGQAILDDLDRTTDDADLAARGVTRHDEELDEIREWIAAYVEGLRPPPVVVEVIEPRAVEEPMKPEQPTQPEIPAQPKRPKPLPGPRTVPSSEAITPEAFTGAQREPDVEYARMLAELEDQLHDWRKYRESLEWAK